MNPEQQQQPATTNPTPFDINTNPYIGSKPLPTDNSKTKRIAVGIIIGVALLLLTPLLFMLARPSDKTKEQAIENVVTESQAPSLDPATSIMLNQATASISQDLSQLDDTADFADETLADKPLGL